MKNKLRRQVRRDVRAAYRPVLKALRNEKQGLRREEEAELGRIGNIYSDLAKSLGGLVPQNNRANQGILEGVQGALGSITGAGMDPAMAKALGTMGAGFATNLGSQALASQSGIASGIAAGGMQGADAEARIIERYKQHLNDITSQMHGVKGDRAQTFLTQLQAARDHQLAKKEQELRASQFDKTFKHNKREENEDDKAVEEGRQWVLNQMQREALAKKQAKWRKQLGIADLNSQIASMEEQLAAGLVDPIQAAEFNENLTELRKELRRKRSAMKRRTKRYKKKVND